MTNELNALFTQADEIGTQYQTQAEQDRAESIRQMALDAIAEWELENVSDEDYEIA